MSPLGFEELKGHSIARLSGLLERRSISPVELTDAYLSRIERLDGLLHSYVHVDADRARREAREAEREIRAGRYRGPLHGVPIGIKDNLDTAGSPTTAGSRLLDGRIASVDATVVTRLRGAGAIILGKQMMHEFAFAAPYLDDSLPPARNPWDLTRVPGGSSSGSGAAVAAGLSVAAVGSDTLGSVRAPASWCGVVGMKPTYGLVSRRGLIPLAWTLDQVGPIGRSVEDVAVLLSCLAGHDAADATSSDVVVPDYSTLLGDTVAGKRVGVPWRYIESAPGLADDVLTAFGSALTTLSELGGEVQDIEIEALQHAVPIGQTIILSEALAIHEAGFRMRKQDYGRGFLERLHAAGPFTASDYIQAQRGRALLSRAVQETMRSVDIIATPTSSRTAPTFAEQEMSPIMGGYFTGIYNLTGQPSLSVPCGTDQLGLPIGLLLSGTPFADIDVLQVAHAYEQAIIGRGAAFDSPMLI